MKKSVLIRAQNKTYQKVAFCYILVIANHQNQRKNNNKTSTNKKTINPDKQRFYTVYNNSKVKHYLSDVWLFLLLFCYCYVTHRDKIPLLTCHDYEKWMKTPLLNICISLNININKQFFRDSKFICYFPLLCCFLSLPLHRVINNQKILQ